MIFKKWNYKTHKYDDYEIPDDKKILLYSDEMDEIINCTQCLKEVRFGETYTSLEIHTEIGFGFPVCDECYQKEWERRKEYQDEYNSRKGSNDF